jgi:FkbM family methyltransferase
MIASKLILKHTRKIIHTGNLLICANDILGLEIRILHVGAHAGQERNLYTEYGINDVFWVEPLPHLVKELKVLFTENRVIPFAVWSTRTKMKLQIANNEVSSSLYKFASSNPFTNQRTIKEIEVETITLDDVIEKYLPQDDKPFILVLDIQGSEYESLRGLTKINTKNIVGMVVEVSETPIYEGAATADKIRKILNQLGYVKTLSLVRPPTNHGDELFIKKSEFLSLSTLFRALTQRILIKISLSLFLLREKRRPNAPAN